MATREEIREGMQSKLKDTCKKTIGIGCYYNYNCKSHPECMYNESLSYVQYLHSQGVVIKGKLLTFDGEPVGYEVKPLIEEE